MSSLGNKIFRKAQVLGDKIKSTSRSLGEKANEALRMADVGLRKTENTLQNRILPLATVLTPEFLPGGLGALAGIKGLRSHVKNAKSYAQDLEKGNIRKRIEDDILNSNSNPNNSFM
jgi:hypothetical protein